ncbi:BglG family transcription antiterminator [Halobacillus kuroshimensis]|uniref:BglG family transcription antiterminator n=1 Tax=Halobacillus kuroshimensis TaxID=302481 RepID=UPI00040BA5A5|nr:BglG family transcription antiterminator [Halobacillus kuroshimensis]
MVLDKRRAHLISILNQSTTPVAVQDLAFQMNVSPRTVYYDVEQINDWLAGQQLDLLETRHGEGLCLPESSRHHLEGASLHFDGWHYQLSRKERTLLIKANILLQPHASMNTFMDLTHMSRGTVAKAIAALKQEFDQTGLTLHYQKGAGYQVDGPEDLQRLMLLNLVVDAYSHPEWVTVQNNLQHMALPSFLPPGENSRVIKRLLFAVEEQLGATFTDEMADLLALQMLMMVKRIDMNQFVHVQPEEKEVLKQTDAYISASVLSQELEKVWPLVFPEDEICFMTMNLLSSKVQHDDISRYSERESEGLRQVIHQMIEDFQIYSFVVFDDRKGLAENLLSHIKPAYYRIKYGVKVTNELSQNIQETYADLYHLTKRVMKHLELFIGRPVPEEETAYITLHFGGWLNKEKKAVETKYRGIIVCENGIGTSNMLRSQLEELIAGLRITAILSKREYQKNKHDTDVVFSTNYVKSDEVPVIHVPAILNNFEKERVIQIMNQQFETEPADRSLPAALMETIQKYATIHQQERLQKEITILLDSLHTDRKELRKPMLNELLTKDTIQLQEQAPDWEEAIRTAAQPLIDKASIHPDYVEAMITNVKELGPYIVIAPRIAIPHARPESGVEQLGMSLLKLNEPVSFSDKEKHKAQLIIILAAIDNQTHLKALAQLTELLSDEKAVDRMIEASSNEEILHLINQTIEV